jgi:hypothetical protein
MSPELVRLSSTARYRYYDVDMNDGTTVRVKTNLFPEDLEKFFPSIRERQMYMRMLASISPLWNAERKKI